MFPTNANIARVLTLALVAITGVVMNGCGDNNPMGPSSADDNRATPREPSPMTQIVGSASLLPGAAGDLQNSMAAIYTSIEEWYNYMPVKFVRVSGSGPVVSFTFGNLLPGTYFVDVWKDGDNSARWSAGDFVGWYGTGALGSPNFNRVQVREGETVSVGDIFMYLLVNNAEAERARGEAVAELD